MITKLVPAKVAAVAVGALLSTGAAAAAGVLPGTLQSVASDALGAVGLQVPDGSGSGSDPLDVLDQTTTTTVDETTTTTLDDTTTTTLPDTTTTTMPTGGEDDPASTPNACTSAANHGQFVSGVARSTPPGPGHGAAVSEAAQSNCGRQGGDGEDVGEEVIDDEDGQNRGPGSSSSNRGHGNGNGGPGNGNGNGGPGNGNGNGGPGNSGSGGRGGRG